MGTSILIVSLGAKEFDETKSDFKNKIKEGHEYFTPQSYLSFYNISIVIDSRSKLAGATNC